MHWPTVSAKITTWRECPRLLATPILITWAVALPLCISSYTITSHNALSIVPTFSSSLSSSMSSLIVADGYSAFAEACRNTWQAQSVSTTPALSPTGSATPSHQGGLVGAPLDPAFGQANEVGMLADYGYDTAQDIARYATLVVCLLTSTLHAFRLRKWQNGGQLTAGKIAKALIYVLTLTAAVHMIGTFIINNSGGLGGCCM